MPLITCPDCGKQISDKSDKCIHCGCPMTTEKQSIANPPAEKASISEKVYYNNHAIYVSNKIVKVNARTFNPNLITSVSVNEVVNPIKAALVGKCILYRIISAPCVLISAICFVVMLNKLGSESSYQRDDAGPLFIAFAIFGGFAALLIWRSIVASQKAAPLGPWGRIDFDTSSGREKNVVTTELCVSKQVEKSIVDMIIGKNN